MPHKPEEYDDSEIVIINTCILLDMDVSDADTIDCNKFEREELNDRGD
jgi:hypothetical protein